MKTCPKCGNVIQNDNARFCKECGTDLYGKNDGGIWLGDVSGQSDKSVSSKKTKKNDAPMLKYGIIGGALIALIIILLFVFSGSDNNENVIPQPSKPAMEQVETKRQSSPTKSEANQPRKETNDETSESTSEHHNNTTTVNDPVETVDSQQERLSTALSKGDYKQVQLLANEGYAPAYVPLAKYYLNNNEYDDANKYAQKAKAAGQSGAQAIITTLDNLGYYD